MPRPWVAIDFETASSEGASACALGIAVIEGDRIAKERHWLIQPPGNHFERMFTRVHGIDAELVAQEPQFAEVWREVEPYLAGAVVLAHNAPFDMRVLRASLRHYGIPTPSTGGYHCTVTLSRKMLPELPRHRLPDVCEHCGIELRHHDAASDAAACARVALHCLRVSGEPSLAALVRSLGMSAGRL